MAQASVRAEIMLSLEDRPYKGLCDIYTYDCNRTYGIWPQIVLEQLNLVSWLVVCLQGTNVRGPVRLAPTPAAAGSQRQCLCKACQHASS